MKKNINIPVVVDPSQILSALVGLKDIRILFYKRNGPVAEIAIEQVSVEQRCPSCDKDARGDPHSGTPSRRCSGGVEPDAPTDMGYT